MNHWLMKTDPAFEIDDLAKKPRKTAMWDGVRNYQVRNMLRDDFRKGDLAFMYHSSSDVIGVAGVIQVVRTAYPDPTQFDKKSEYYDPKADPKEPRWFVVDVKFKRKYPKMVELKTLKETPGLESMGVVMRGQRLSVMPVTPEEWAIVLKLAKG